VRLTDRAEGDAKVASGIWDRVHDEDGKLVGYQPLDASPSDEQLPSQNSNPCISMGEMQANAGVCFARGKSRTENMPEAKRLGRKHPLTGRLLPAEDFIERSIEKVKLWTRPAPGRGDRAVRVYPKGATV
jgi:hypothetical protein